MARPAAIARIVVWLVFALTAHAQFSGVIPAGDNGPTQPPSVAGAPPTLFGISGGGSVELGQNVTLTVTFAGNGAGQTYQWKRNGTEIAGATASSFSIAAAAPADAGTYSVVVRNSEGESVSATELTVRPAAAPVILNAPRTAVAQVGQQVTFSVVASGSYPRTYQWRKDGANLSSGTQALLTLPAVTTADAGAYSVTITNSIGSVTSASASLTVNAATPITIASFSPADATATQGSSLTLSVSLTAGSAPFTYAWRKNGAALPGATQSQLALASLALSDAGSYSVVVSNPAGSVTSREATLTVNPATPPIIVSPPRDVAVFAGQRATFSVSANGSPPFSYQWQKNGAAISGATSSAYTINAVTAADAGGYSVAVSNVAGSTTSTTATLTVNAAVAPTIANEPRDLTLTDGESGSFSVAADGSPPLAYQWYFNGVRLPSGTSSSLSVTARPTDAGSYYVVVSNPGGSVTSRTVVLTVNPTPPPPVVRLFGPNATLGESFNLSATHFSSRPVSYQWYRNGEPIAGATSSSLQIARARAEDAADYFVVLTNSGGSTTSRTARVTLTLPTSAPTGGWIAAERSGDVVHFAFANPPRIERFDLAAETWLAPIPLPRSPRTFAVATDRYYVSSGNTVYRYNLDGSGEAPLTAAFDTDVLGLVVWRGFILVQHGGYNDSRVTSIRASDGARISSYLYLYRWGPAMVAGATSGRVFSRTTGISPSDITMTTIQADGTLAPAASESPYHGSYPDATRLMLSPDETLVADNSGTIYRANNLTFAASLGGRVDDLTFTSSNGAVALRGGTLTVYDSRLLEIGRLALGLDAARLFVRGNDVFAFAHPSSGGSITHAKRSLTEAARPATGPVVDANTIAFTPDAQFLDRNGELWLYSKLHRQLFRWSPAARRYVSSIPLLGWPDHVAYSAALHRIYLGYSDTRIFQVKLDAGAVAEEIFATAPQGVLALATAGEYVFVLDPTSPWVSYVTYNGDGRLIDQRAWSYSGAEYAWNPVLRRMYQFRDDTSPNDLLFTEIKPDGTFGTQRDSPFHGEISTRYPIRITPDGSSVLLGSGIFYDADTLRPNNSLANAIDDAVWLGARLYTGRISPTGTEIQRWGGGNYALDRDRIVPGRLVRMFAVSANRVLVLTAREGALAFTLLDEDLNELSSDFGGALNRLANLAARAMVGRGDQILIPGFAVAGPSPKRMLIRAAGPALAGFGVTGFLADPSLSVHDQSGTAIAANDDWSRASNVAEIATIATRVGAFAFESGSRDAAVLVTLSPGAYTVQTRGANDGTGVALVEVYDAQDAGNTTRIVNLAARAQVGTGADVLIPGIVIQGSAPKTLLIRAVGPALSSFGVGGLLANPRLRLFRGEQMLQENDDWDLAGTASSQIAAAATRAGAFALPAGSRDAALLVTLPPGSYTAQVSGADGGSGVALVEVYEVSP